MFTGIIEGLGRIVGIAPVTPPDPHVGRATRLEIDAAGLLDELSTGASVAVNGACLTLVGVHSRGRLCHTFDVVPETWRRTSLARLQTGDLVNLERSLRVGDRIDGHFVQGHVDGIGTVQRIDRAGGEWKLWVAVATALTPFVVPKGSIAVDGVSLTIVDAHADRFSVALIPTTLERTILGRLRPGDIVNIETDILARLVISRLAALQAASPDGQPARAGVTWEQLRDGGYLT